MADIESYVVYDQNDKESVQRAVAALDQATDEYSGRVHASHQRMGFSPFGVGGDGVAGRYGLTHTDYEAWRPEETSRFKNAKQAILHADICYHRHGLIKNVIDLMGDFASQGIRLVHPNKRIEKFFQNWFRKVRGIERSERFLNNLYRLGNVVVRVQTAKVKAKNKETLFRARAIPDLDISDLNIIKNEIPWKYTFLHPATIDVQGGPLASFVGQPQYLVNVPRNLLNIVKSPRNDAEKSIVAQLPAEIRNSIESSKPIPLPQDKTRVFHYKKDDWLDWSFPIISSIALDISLYEKLKLADRAALDGAISNIRIFKLGNLEHHIVPTPKAASKLADILQSNTQAGTLDLIWGPDIEMVESKTSVHQFLGQGKYEPTLIAIYAGLGIPPTLTGTFGASGTTNNFVSLKTLTQRLEYGRDILVSFWNEQIRIVQEAMGFRFPARVEFDLMNLGDEASEKSLLIQLADRNLISDELLQHYFGSDPEMERIRTNNEFRERDKKSRAEKAGPFYDPQYEEAIKKTAIQTGISTPSEVGVELEPRKKGEKSAMDMKKEQVAMKPKGPEAKKPGVSGQGRPKNTPDSQKRQTKTFKPKVKASLIIWASSAFDSVSEILNPVLLEKFDKKNMRSLSHDQFLESEKIKFSVFCSLEPFKVIDEKSIYDSLSRSISKDLIHGYEEFEKSVAAELDRDLNVQERKDLKVQFYTELFEKEYI